MSRVGRVPITIPSGVKVQYQTPVVRVEGPKGKTSIEIGRHSAVQIKVEQTSVTLERKGNSRQVKALHGLYRMLIANMVYGVTQGFSKELEIVGVGYRAQMKGKDLLLNVGFSHDVIVPIPQGITVEVPKPTSLIIKGVDKQQVGQFAANIRKIWPPEPYKGKGIKYVGEVIRRKAGKAATGTKSG